MNKTEMLKNSVSDYFKVFLGRNKNSKNFNIGSCVRMYTKTGFISLYYKELAFLIVSFLFFQFYSRGNWLVLGIQHFTRIGTSVASRFLVNSFLEQILTNYVNEVTMYDLIGVDGNAFSIMAYVLGAMREQHFSTEELAAYQEDAMSGDYNHLLVVSSEMIDKCNEKGGHNGL